MLHEISLLWTNLQKLQSFSSLKNSNDKYAILKIEENALENACGWVWVANITCYWPRTLLMRNF